MPESSPLPNLEALPEPLTVRERGISLVWLVPLLALLIGGWIAWKGWSERGPTVVVAFDNAEGIEAGKTRLRYKNVELGRVEGLSLGEDSAKVEVRIQMTQGGGRFLNADTRFWIVRPRVGLGEVSGLSTIVSGAYLGLEPGQGEEDGSRYFEGLEAPPVVAIDAPGRYFRLSARQLGSLGPKSPVYFRRIKVGEVVESRLQPDGQAVEIHLFIHAPYHELVYANTRFWHASGVEASLGADGIQLHTESVESLLVGGVAFGLFDYEAPAETARAETVFPLYEGRNQAREGRYSRRDPYLLLFEGSVRGLSEGAPVEFQGIRLGRVRSVELDLDPVEARFRIPVVIEIEPERLDIDDRIDEAEARRLLQGLVARGLRARLKPGNLLTGQLYVALEMKPDAPPAAVDFSGPYPAIPTLPSDIEELTQRITALLARLEGLPLESIAGNLDGLLVEARAALDGAQVATTAQHTRNTLRTLDTLLQTTRGQVEGMGNQITQTLSRAEATLERADATLAAAREAYGSEAPLHFETLNTLTELQAAARSVRLLVDYLQRDPNALLLGRGTQ
jgi:paraquat-inducible protein B